MLKHKKHFLGPEPYQDPTKFKVISMLKAQVQAITTVTPVGAGPLENNICRSYMSGMTRLVLVQEHPDSSGDSSGADIYDFEVPAAGRSDFPGANTVRMTAQSIKKAELGGQAYTGRDNGDSDPGNCSNHV